MTLSEQLLAGLQDSDLDEAGIRDHHRIAEALARGERRDTLLAMPEANRWPDTYAWLSARL